MAMRSRYGHTGKAELQQYDLDLEAGEQYTLELEGPEDTDVAMIVVETAGGELDVEFAGERPENRSRYARAKLFLLHGASSITLKVRNTVAEKIRVSVAFVRKEITEALTALPCRTCTLLLGILLSAICAGLGLPFFDIPESIDVPAVPDIDERMTTGPAGMDIENLGLDLSGDTMEIENEAPIAQFNEEQQAAIRELATGRGQLGFLGELVEATDARLFAALVTFFEGVNWVFRLRQRVYKTVCAEVGFCDG